MGWSFGVHVLAACLAWGFLAWEKAYSNSIDIDLSGSSLLLTPVRDAAAPRRARPPEPWVLSLSGKAAAPSKAQPQPLSATAEPEGEACPPPCPASPGDWLPAAATSRKPDWVDGLITEDDYPSELRRGGKEGRVVVDVLIDATGKVRDVQLVLGSEAAFNALVLERLKVSGFRPAYDREGNAVPCRLRMPITFELH